MTNTPISQPATATVDETPLTAAEADAIARGHGNPVKVVDPGSDLVDADPMHETEHDLVEKKPLSIVYHFSGGNLGGQQMVVCSGKDGCSALLQEDASAAHTLWHQNFRP